jgi:hypothetical protein
MSQHFAQQPMLIMPQVVDPEPIHPEALGQMRAHGLNKPAPAGTSLDQLDGIQGGLHIFLAGSHHADALLLCELLLELQINEAFVGRHDPAKAFDQQCQMVDVMGSSRQERAVDDPAHVGLGQEPARRLARAMDTLPFYEQAVLRLLVHQGCSYQDIAAMMDTPISTVRTRVSRACHRLRAHVVAVDAASLPSLPHVSIASRRCTHP